MNRLAREIRFALRQMRKAPGLTAVAVLTLAFGIGATTAIFSIVEGVLLRPLPFPRPHELVELGDDLVGMGDAFKHPRVPAPEVLQYQHEAKALSSLGGFRDASYELSGVGAPAQVTATRLTASVFPTLGVSPSLGRVFTQKEDDEKQRVAVISYAMWQTRFHGDPGVLGAKILLDRVAYEVIGVMPRSFEFPLNPGQLNRSEFWVPMSFSQGELVQGAGSWNFRMVGRLKPGVTLLQAQVDLRRVAQQIMRGYPASMSSLQIESKVVSLDESTVAAARPLIRTLFSAVAVVLFIACANLAGLLLVRVIRRRREIAVRLALGATDAVILRQTLVETLMLSLAGGLAGLSLASLVLKAGISFLPETLPRIDAIELDWKVVTFALGLAVMTGLVCGILPALAAKRTGVNEALKEGGRTGSGGRAHGRLRAVLVVSEIAVALVLLVAAGLLLRSFEKLRTVDLGFATDHMMTAQYSLPREQYSSQAAVNAFNRAAIEKLRSIAGVQAVGITSILPVSGQDDSTAFYAEGYVSPKRDELNEGWPSSVLGDYFRAAGIPMLRGRAFTDADDGSAPLVVIVNRALAERYWPGQDPIGKRIHIGLQSTPLPWMTVVGEIADIKQTSADAPTGPQFYQPASQFARTLGQFARPGELDGNNGALVVRSTIPADRLADELRAVVRSIDPQLPLTQLESMQSVVHEGQAPQRFNTVMVTSFAIAAVGLALLGIYSVIAFSAALRTQEMAIRLALGEQRSSVMRLVLVSGAKLSLLGCGIGGVGALFATRLMRSLLFQVDVMDPLVIAGSVAAILTLAVVASLIPARRAASIQPVEALRMD